MYQPGLTFTRFVAILMALSLAPIQLFASGGLLPAATTNAFLLADTTPPVINVWYGTNQSFTMGTPQNWINILGNVSEDPGTTIQSLSYTLNGSASRSLRIGPDQRRLAAQGDFNVDIAISDPSLNKNGSPNTVVIRAANSVGLSSQQTVTFTYNASTAWSLPYTINWSNISNAQQAVQIVDGVWQVSSTGIRPTQIAYDRVLAIGDLTWKDYEVLVPVTINSVDFTVGGNPNSGFPTIGIDLRWTGHTDKPTTCTQPKCGWLPTGGAVRYTWRSATASRLQIETSTTNPTPDTSIYMVPGGKYWFRVKVETNANGTLYSAKYWVNGNQEPSGWTLTKQTLPGDPDYLSQGSFLLVAHHADVTFGNIIVTLPGQAAPTTYTLNVATSGNGSVSKNPNKSAYLPGELVSLTATPASGWEFQSWSDNSTAGNVRQVVINSNISLTATFRQANPNQNTVIHMPMIFK